MIIKCYHKLCISCDHSYRWCMINWQRERRCFASLCVVVAAAAGTWPSRRGSCSSVVCHPYLGWAVTPRMWLQPWRVIDEDDKLLSAFPYIRKMAMMMDGCSCITETYWNMFLPEVGTLARRPVGCSQCSLPATGARVYSDLSIIFLLWWLLKHDILLHCVCGWQSARNTRLKNLYMCTRPRINRTKHFSFYRRWW